MYLKFLINIVTLGLLIGVIYNSVYKRRDFYLTFFSFNSVIFFLAYFLNQVDLGLGAAFGLFAVFSMLRYRTESITSKDMTYLFLVIAIGLISAVCVQDLIVLLSVNATILALVFLFESNLIQKKESTMLIQYDNFELIRPENKPALMLDICSRTGFKVHRTEIITINFVANVIAIRIFYTE